MRGASLTALAALAFCRPATSIQLADKPRKLSPSLGYHRCRGEQSEIRMYTVSQTENGHRDVHREDCVSKEALDFKPSSTYALFTMAGEEFHMYLKELLRSMARTATNDLPTRIVVLDVGMTPEQRADLPQWAPVRLEFVDERTRLEVLRNISDIHPAKELMFEDADFSSGAHYRLKAVAINEWLAKMTEDQLLWLDAGGLMFGSPRRLRNFAAAEGFYAGALAETALSAMFASVGRAPPETQAARKRAFTDAGLMPSCFDYETDWLIDETHDLVGHDDLKQLGSFEGGMIAVDRRHKWPIRLMKAWADIVGSNERFAQAQGYYFAHDQKILTNEIWKQLICSDGAGPRRLLDVDNVRFGSVIKYAPSQPFKKGYSLAPGEEMPWAGYAYHFCMNPGTDPDFIVRHPCGIEVAPGEKRDSFPPNGWEQLVRERV